MGNTEDHQITLPQQPTATLAASASESKNVVPQPRSLWKSLKRYAWRCTGLYVWFLILSALFTDNRLPHVLGSKLANFFVEKLAVVGFAPSEALHLPLVLKVWWVLSIVQFEAFELLGLSLYVLSFPVLFLFYLPFRREVDQIVSEASDKKTEHRGLAPKRYTFPVVPICASLLFGWYLLYGGSTTRLTLVPAIVFSGVLFLLIAYRAFQRAKPTGQSDIPGLLAVEGYAIKALNSIVAHVQDKTKSPSGLPITLKIFRWQRWSLIYLAAFLKGKRGKDRVYFLLVLQYALSLLLLGTCAVLFWTLAVRSIEPGTLSLSVSTLLVLHHFLSGISVPNTGIALPLWADLGPGMTAWVLIGAYVAASGSLLPGKQQAYAERAQKTYVTLRLTAVRFNQLFQILRRMPRQPAQK